MSPCQVGGITYKADSRTNTLRVPSLTFVDPSSIPPNSRKGNDNYVRYRSLTLTPRKASSANQFGTSGFETMELLGSQASTSWVCSSSGGKGVAGVGASSWDNRLFSPLPSDVNVLPPTWQGDIVTSFAMGETYGKFSTLQCPTDSVQNPVIPPE